MISQMKCHLVAVNAAAYSSILLVALLFGYLTSYRINKSVDLIRDTDMSIAQIAAAVGFCSQSYYTDNFRKEKGITPKKFKLLSMRFQYKWGLIR